jgi:hypothetical protein
MKFFKYSPPVFLKSPHQLLAYEIITQYMLCEIFKFCRPLPAFCIFVCTGSVHITLLGLHDDDYAGLLCIRVFICT